MTSFKTASYKEQIAELQIILEERRLIVKKLRENVHAQNFKQLTANANINQSAQIIVPDSENAKRQKTLQHIKEFIKADLLFSGIHITVNQKVTTDSLENYLLTGKAGLVLFDLEFNWCKVKQRITKTQLNIRDALQQLELAPSVNRFVRENNVQKLSRVIREYSVLMVARETVLEHLSGKYHDYFQFSRASDLEGCTIEIKSLQAGRQYLKATWTISWFKARFSMDHSFCVEIFKEADALGKDQVDLLQKLVQEENLSQSQLIKMFTKLIVNFERWIMSNTQAEDSV